MKHMYYDVKTSDTCVSQLEASLAVRQKWQSNIQNILLFSLFHPQFQRIKIGMNGQNQYLDNI